MKIKKIAIIGLGYVGLPLAIGLSKHFKIVGFDLNIERIKQINQGIDVTREVENKTLKKVLKKQSVLFCSNETPLRDCNIFIVTVPTPVTEDNKPDFSPLIKACEIISRNFKKNSVVVFESTVYPGATQEICGKAIEKNSGFKMEKDFFLGYSPERINPGDRVHTLGKITKVISAEKPVIESLLKNIYSKLTSNIYIAKNIKVAEASKVIENAQRDINIAFINEITKISNKLNLSIYDVLEASLTKWNFLDFTPGLVGGHCIGVDPYYIATKARNIGIEPKVILAGRKINDEMSQYIGNEINKKIKKKSNILILGLSFKEDVPDTRNSKVIDLVEFFIQNKHNLTLCDPLINEKSILNKKIIKDLSKLEKKLYDVIILSVNHQYFKKISKERIKSFLNKDGLFADIRGYWRKNNDFKNYWSL